MYSGRIKTLVRHCSDYGTLGCDSASYGGETAEICYCDTSYCNGAVKTSFLGYEIMVVALLINVIIGYLP